VPESYPFPMYSGLLEPEHYKKIGSAIWLFLWCVSSTTKEVERDGVNWGIVLGNKPLKIKEDIAPLFDVSEKTISRWIKDLENNGYIKTTRAPHGLIFSVKKSKKFIKRTDKNVSSQDSDKTKMSILLESDQTDLSERTDKNVRCNKDITEINKNTTTKENDPIDLIAEKYIDLRTMQEGKAVYPTTKDYEAIAQIIARAVPPVQIIKLLEQCFEEYNKRNPNGSIKAFSYCEKYILDHHAALQAKEDAKKLAKRKGRVQSVKKNEPANNLLDKYDFGTRFG